MRWQTHSQSGVVGFAKAGKEAKKSTRAPSVSAAVVVSLAVYGGFSPSTNENPTPGGLSMNSTFARVFQRPGFTESEPSAFMVKGPCSRLRPM